MLVAIITIIIATIVVFNHQLVWLLAVFPGLYIAYAFFIAYSKAPKLKQGLHLTDAESQAWKEHHAFFRFPFAARKMAGSLSALQFISVILAVVLVFTGAYWGAVFLLGWLLGLPTPRLNPEASIAPAAQKGSPDAVERLKALESLQAKLKSPEKYARATDSSKNGYNYLVNKYLDNKSNDLASSTQSSHRTPPKMAVIGIGGAGVATINRFTSISGMPTKRFVAIDSDVTAIRNSKAHTKITLEKTEGSIDDIKAKMVIYEAEDKIIKATSGVGVDVAFLIVGTGGKTGFHAWNIIAKMLQEKGILTVVFAIKPFSFEEDHKHLNARVADESRDDVDVFVDISNDRMLQAVPKSTPLNEAFKILDYALVDAIKGVYSYIASGGKDKENIQMVINKSVDSLMDK